MKEIEEYFASLENVSKVFGVPDSMTLIVVVDCRDDFWTMEEFGVIIFGEKERFREWSEEYTKPELPLTLCVNDDGIGFLLSKEKRVEPVPSTTEPVCSQEPC